MPSLSTRLLVPLWWAWAINFLKGPHKKMGIDVEGSYHHEYICPCHSPFHWVIAASSSLIWSSSRYPTYKNEQLGCITDNTDFTAPIQRQEEKVKIVHFSTEAPDFPHSPQSILLLFACTGVHSQMLSCSLMASLSKSLVAKMGQTALCVFTFESYIPIGLNFLIFFLTGQWHQKKQMWTRSPRWFKLVSLLL